jgi:hypothetical protein
MERTGNQLIMRYRFVMSAGALVLGAAVLAGCQHKAPMDATLPPQQVESGSTLTLLTPLTFPSGRSELLFQGQRQVNAEALSKNLPYCKLASLNATGHSLVPGPMKVGNVSYDEREAGTGSAMFSITRISLLAGTQQPGYAMSCGWPTPTQAPAFLSTEQIYGAIGGQFTMQLLR